MWCDNLPRNRGNRGKLLQVKFPFNLLINYHSVTIDRNPILFNCGQGFYRNFGISAFMNIEYEKYKKQNVSQLGLTISIWFHAMSNLLYKDLNRRLKSWLTQFYLIIIWLQSWFRINWFKDSTTEWPLGYK